MNEELLAVETHPITEMRAEPLKVTCPKCTRWSGVEVPEGSTVIAHCKTCGLTYVAKCVNSQLITYKSKRRDDSGFLGEKQHINGETFCLGRSKARSIRQHANKK
ncbi:hypothetical protein [Butyrivibrio sp. INlla16]|uniref:hypothetical protein n=1 Tax=Butyrivibrio sp. INlla16 TaxID=1520807 RepID=UPI00087F959F|nr:hypothetical protein [Butyrivibrio sp. INlla16]SDB51585.1 hypothetical protein SAMN02910263_02590 [Butyrivibrio sp. INlla16]